MPTGERRGDMFSAADIKKLYSIPRSEVVTDDARHAKGWFIYNTMIGSGWECKEWHQDFLPFNLRYKPRWDLLYKRHIESNRSEWPVFEEDRLDFIDNASQRTINTFLYPNEYAAPTVAPQTSSQTE